MLWFFERDREQVEVETRFENATQEYVLVVRWPDGRTMTERNADAESFQRRLEKLEQDLQSERWRSTGSPVVLSNGWPDKRPLR